MTASRIQPLLKHFPPVSHAFAYGSGVMHQPGLYEKSEASTSSRGQDSSPMIDMIFAVDDAHAWHAKNIMLNKNHYSWLGRSERYGPDLVCGIADHIGVGVHFNALVSINGQLVKYGVVEMQPLQNDLISWNRMYVSGRMHKPTVVLKENADMVESQAYNVRSALNTALLLLPGAFSTESLLHSVCGLSYRGDIRMGLAEDPHKVSRIVSGSRSALERMYLPLLTTKTGQAKEDWMKIEIPSLVTQVSEGHWQQDVSDGARRKMLSYLPVGVIHEMSQRLGLSLPKMHLKMVETREEVLDRVMATGKPTELVSRSLRAIVWRSSISQALAGFLASGGGKAFEYVARKVRKAACARAPPQQT